MSDWIAATCVAVLMAVILLAIIAGGVALLDGLL